MSAIDRKKLRESLKKNMVKWNKDHLLVNTLPTSVDEFNDSEWEKWLNRIQKGKEIELQWLNSIPEDTPHEELENYAEEISIANAISNDMYAAFCVHIWSRFEKTFTGCKKAWNLEASSKVKFDAHKIKEIVMFFYNTATIDLKRIKNYEFVNAIRTLSNCYKHNNGRYKPDGYPIDPTLLTQWDIEEKHSIVYSELPLKEIIINCGYFLKDLLELMRIQIDSPH